MEEKKVNKKIKTIWRKNKELKELHLKEVRESTWDSLCRGYDMSEDTIKAECIIDINEIIDWVFKITYKRAIKVNNK